MFKDLKKKLMAIKEKEWRKELKKIKIKSMQTISVCVILKIKIKGKEINALASNNNATKIEKLCCALLKFICINYRQLKFDNICMRYLVNARFNMLSSRKLVQEIV